jgi:hypothetical protein
MKPKKVVYADGKYEITLENGEVVTCAELVSVGKKKKDDHNFDHILHFSDGTVDKFVSSVEIVRIPDYSLLSP